MKVYKFISRSRIIYTEAPEEVISPLRLYYFIRIYHFIPTVIVAIIITVKILPKYFSTIDDYVQSYSSMVRPFAIGSFITIGLINGFVIEKLLALTNSKYRLLKAKVG
jgi:hypothetical protein